MEGRMKGIRFQFGHEWDFNSISHWGFSLIGISFLKAPIHNALIFELFGLYIEIIWREE